MKDFYTPQEATDELKGAISRSTLTLRIKEEEVKAIRLGGKFSHYKIPKIELIKLKKHFMIRLTDEEKQYYEEHFMKTIYDEISEE